MGYVAPNVKKINASVIDYTALIKAIKRECSWSEVKPLEVPEEPSIFFKIFHPKKSKEIIERIKQNEDFNERLKARVSQEIEINKAEIERLQKALEEPITPCEPKYM